MTDVAQRMKDFNVGWAGGETSATIDIIARLRAGDLSEDGHSAELCGTEREAGPRCPACVHEAAMEKLRNTLTEESS